MADRSKENKCSRRGSKMKGYIAGPPSPSIARRGPKCCKKSTSHLLYPDTVSIVSMVIVESRNKMNKLYISNTTRKLNILEKGFC
jgi:hypothetical protein